MIIPDANLLLYAYDAGSRWHEPAKLWWEALLSGDEPVGLCAPVIFAFIRVATNPRIYIAPMSLKIAVKNVESWIAQQPVRFLSFEKIDIPVATNLLLESQEHTGRLATDVQIAAIAIRLRATVHTSDTDFYRFPNLSWKNPLDTKKLITGNFASKNENL